MGAREGRGGPSSGPSRPPRRLELVVSAAPAAPATWKPMLANPVKGRVTDALVGALTDSHQWLFDLKWDGIRAGLRVQDGRPLALVNRDGRDISLRYPELFEDADGPGLFGDGTAIVDGELVCLGEGSRPDFAAVHRRDAQSSLFMIRRLSRETPVVFMAFDLLALGGEDLRGKPLARRLEVLTECLGDKGAGRIMPSLRHPDGRMMWQRVVALELEGLIAKRIGSRYVGGRSDSWAKLKNTRVLQACVVGWTEGKGARAGSFGALELALVDEHRNLVEVGSVGTGFSDADLTRIRQRLAAGEQLVVDIEYLEVGSGGKLRFPSFKGVRDDVAPADCTTAQLTRRSGQKGT